MLVDAESLKSYTIDIIDLPYGNISMSDMYNAKEDRYEIEDYVGKINNKYIVINHRESKVNCIYYDNSITKGKKIEYYLMVDGYCIPKIFNSFNDAFMSEEIWN